MNNSKIINRILAENNIVDGFNALAETMPQSDLQSLLLEVYNIRARSITAKNILQQYQQNRFVRPAKTDPRQLLAFDSLAYSMLPPEYQILALSPVCPFGTTTAVAPHSQDIVLTTVRNTEVCSDSTGVMALEATTQRKLLLQQPNSKTQRVKLCCSQRMIRTQPVNNPDFYPHFQLFSLCIAGKDEGSHQFELNTLDEIIRYYYKLLFQYLITNTGIEPKIKITIATRETTLATKIKTLLSTNSHDQSNLTFIIENDPTENWNYYSQLRFRFFITNNDHQDFFILDGGDTNWTQQLLNNKKERYMISGLGSELLINSFKNRNLL